VNAARIALVSFVLLPAAGLRAQAPAADPQQAAPIERQTPQIPTIHVESRLVSVAMNVVDATGAPVGGLTQADFEIAEDGKPQKIAVFEKESSTPLEIVLAIDASESVFADDRLERDAAKSFVRSLLRPQDRLDLMSFSDSVDELAGFTSDTHAIEDGLSRIQHGDATAMYDAVYLASQRLGEAPAAPGARKVVVLITDGENTTHHGSYDDAIEQAERAGAMLYALIIVPVDADAGRNTGGEHALIQMSRDTGGKYYYVEDKHDLGPAFQHVSDDLRTQYTVGYYAPQHGGDGSGLRHIHMELKDPTLRAKYTLRYRTAYYGNR
jgi:Ca-activated chloride channel family protein